MKASDILGLLGLLVFFSFLLSPRNSTDGSTSGGGGECACDDDYGSFWSCKDSDRDGLCDEWDD